MCQSSSTTGSQRLPDGSPQAGLKALRAVVLLILAAALAACILKDTRHTLYLEPDGSVVWTVLEEDVRSDATAPAERTREECDWLATATAGDHPAARGLAWLGGRPQSRVLRSERPFTVWTEARFESLEELARRLVDGLRLPAELEVVTHPDGGALTVVLQLAAVDDSEEAEEALVDLLDDLESARLVLVAGQFIAAEGFELDDDQRTARPLPPLEELLEAKEGALRWSLSWTTAVDPNR